MHFTNIWFDLGEYTLLCKEYNLIFEMCQILCTGIDISNFLNRQSDFLCPCDIKNRVFILSCNFVVCISDRYPTNFYQQRSKSLILNLLNSFQLCVAFHRETSHLIFYFICQWFLHKMQHWAVSHGLTARATK